MKVAHDSLKHIGSRRAFSQKVFFDLTVCDEELHSRHELGPPKGWYSITVVHFYTPPPPPPKKKKKKKK